MFSAKNYGLPKDLIEAAKKVHEKQLMEYDEDGYIKNPPKGMDKGTEEDRTEAAKKGLKGPHLEGEGKLPKKNKKLPPLPVKKPKPKTEEVQFTEEELAEAFAIFLEENFHVEMLTEEDLDYVFENEFPQWLEEVSGNTGIRSKVHYGDTGVGGDISTRKYQGQRAVEKQRAKEAEAEEDPMYDGSGVAKSVDRIAAKITSAPKPTPRNQVSAKPAASARKSAPKIDYKTPVTRRGPDGTYGLTSKGRKYVARKEAQERKKPFSASKFFSQMQRDGN